MKRLLIIASIALLSPLSATHTAAAAETSPTIKKVRPPAATAPPRMAPAPSGTLRARPVSVPEPSGIFGWLVLTDPATGARWFPTDADGRPRGKFSIHLQFRNVQTGALNEVYLTGPSYFFPDSARQAWHYQIRFIHDTTTERAPRREDAARGVRYNPNIWRFSGISGDPFYRIMTPLEGGGQRVDWEARYHRRGAPFADLPDIAP
jgi:hypothetical protein